MPELKNMNYWMRLKTLQINSQQRCFERYRITYLWKILEGKVPNPGGVDQCNSDREGRRVKIPPLKTRSTARVKSLREASSQVHGARLFNALPKSIRDKTHCQEIEFKEILDCYLTKIADQPKIGNMVPACCDQITGAPSNSLVDQIRLHRREASLLKNPLVNCEA